MRKSNVFKKIIALSLSLFIAVTSIDLSMITTNVYAAEEKEEVVQCDEAVECDAVVENSVSISPEDVDLDYTNEELFELYAKKELGLASDDTLYSNDYTGQHLSAPDKYIYEKIKEAASEIADGKRDSAEVTISLSEIEDYFNLSYTKAELGNITIISGGQFTEAAKTAFFKMIQQAVLANNKAINTALLNDCPYELYWYMKTMDTMWALSYSYSGNSEQMTMTEGTLKLTVSLPVDPTYRASDDIYSVNTEKTGKVQTVISRINDILDGAKGLSDYNKLASYKKAICDLVTYDTPASKSSPIALGTIAPWQLINVFDGDESTNVVCEGYSKAFAYLCELTDFECDDIRVYCVSGDMTNDVNGEGAHMWNVAHMGDGKNYVVDVTNCDGDEHSATNPVGFPDKLFLRKYDGLVTSSLDGSTVGYSFDLNLYNGDIYYYVYDTETLNSYLWSEIEISKDPYDPSFIPTHTHSWDDDYTVDKEASCTEAGSKSIHCKKCSDTKDATAIPALGHSWDSGVVTKAPTCTEAGNKAIYCKECGEKKTGSDTVIPALGHDWSEGVVTTKPTYTQKGVKTFTCQNDNSHIKTVDVPTLEVTGDIVEEDINENTESEVSKEEIRLVGVEEESVYTGSAITFDIRVYKGNKLLKEGTDYSLSYKNNKVAFTDDVTELNKVKAPTVIFTGKGLYKSEVQKPYYFKIKRVDLNTLVENGQAVVSNDVAVYSQNKKHKPVPTITINGKKLKNKTDYKVEYEDYPDGYEEKGTYTVKITGNGNYEGELTSTFKVADKTAYKMMSSASVKSYTKSFVYDGTAKVQNPSVVEVKMGKVPLTYDVDYTIEHVNNVEVGTATMIIKAKAGSDKYVGEKAITYKITGTALSKAKAEYDKNYFYTGKLVKASDVNLVLNIKKSATEIVPLTEGKDYTISYLKNVNAGTATIVLTGKGLYTGIVKKTFKIKPVEFMPNKSEENPVISAVVTGKPVKDEAKGTYTVGVEVKNNGKLLVEGVDYTLSYKNNKKPAIAAEVGLNKAPTVTIKGKGNYTKSLVRTFDIIEPAGE